MSKIDWQELKYDLWGKWNSFTRPFENTFHWIVKSFQYSWQLREDFDWDWAFIMKLLKYKLERTRKRIKSNNVIAGVDRVCHQIRIAEILIERILSDEYTPVQDQEIEDKWGPIELRKKKGITRRFVITDTDVKEERKDSMRVYKHQDYMAKQDWDYLFNHMKKYMKHWWD